MLTRRALLTLLPALALALPAAPDSARAGDDPWPSLKDSLFKGRTIGDATGAVQLFAPNQADDAALVPIKLLINGATARSAKSLTLIIDRNPAPVAATFLFGEAYRSGPDIGERALETRVRVDAFSRVRAVIETVDGRLLMASKFVIGAGGCSAPASKDLDAALASLGQARIKAHKDETRSSLWREAQIMIKHPNYSGLQMNPKTGTFQPARFVNALDILEGPELLMRMEGGISISEDPNIRFTYGASGHGVLEFSASDTEGARFSARDVPDPS